MKKNEAKLYKMKNKPSIYLLYVLRPNRRSYYGFDANRRLHLQADISWANLHLNRLCGNFHMTERKQNNNNKPPKKSAGEPHFLIEAY